MTRTRSTGAILLAITAGAILLRLLLLLGRGDYLAFDEGWYLLLGRSLFSGDGYSLIGVPHVTLSPLFPILAGAVGAAIDSWVWGGRLVAAVAAGLLVLPAWSIFRRIATERVALVAAIFVAVVPSLAPFVVPFWIGADLWVGAEPLLHLFLYTGIALWLRAHNGRGVVAWAGAGAAFGLAFLARPEAIIAWGLLGLAALIGAAVRRSPRRLAGAIAMGLGFVVVASPYWLYLHDATGRWALTGRGVSAASLVSAAAPARGGPASTIEQMLWDDDAGYERHLYGLDATGLRLRSEYWGVYPETPASEALPPTADPAPAPPSSAAPRTASEPTPEPPSTLRLYVRALGQILPTILWPLVVVGLAGAVRSRGSRREVAVVSALTGTSLAIAYLVAADPRTQLFLVPLLCFYAARGASLIEDVVRDRIAGGSLRPGFIATALAGIAVVWMLGISGQRLYRSLVYGSPHHVVGEQNRAVAEELDALTAGTPGPVASWHPAIAVYADRDWRVLPFAELPDVLRYLSGAGARVAVLSAYYPPPLGVEGFGTRYLVLPVPRPPVPAGPWGVRILQGDSIRAVGSLVPPR